MPVLDLLREHRFDPSEVLIECGLLADAIGDADLRISMRDAVCLVQRSSLTLNRPDFGLLVGQRLEMSTLGLLGELVGNSPTVGAALHTMCRYFHLQDRGSVIYLRQVEQGIVALGYAVYDAGMPGVGLTYDMVLSMMMKALIGLVGTNFRAVEVHVPHRPPADLLAYRRCFGVPVVFDAPHAELHLESRWLSAPVAGADPSALNRARGAALDADGGERRNWSERIHAVVRVLVMDGTLSASRVADALGVHERTLRRYIACEGTSLNSIVTMVRFDISQQLLRETRLPVSRLAESLGYADATAFVRAFRSWAGCSPGRWRQASNTAVNV